jgi:hypothetical protein
LDRPCSRRAEKQIDQSRRIDDNQSRSRSARTTSADGSLRIMSG